MGAPPDSDGAAFQGFHPVHRVAQSYLGSLWIALDKRAGEPGTQVLLRRLQLPSKTPPEARERILHAGREAIDLRHPQVLPVLEVFEQDREIVIVHEHLEAEPLRSLQSWANLRGLTFPVGVSLKIVNDLLLGVAGVHEGSSSASVSPVGGLSPDSVLVSRAGATQLCDPLIASCASLLEGVGFNTAKLAYAAPEQVHPVAPLTPGCDVFTCGALLWELLAARRLLSGSRAAIERKLLEHNLPSLASNLRSDLQVSSALVELVGKALSADPAQRPSSPEALRQELASCGHELASQAQVAQFVSKLSGQRFDRRNAEVRSKSLPELAAVEGPPASTAAPRSQQAPASVSAVPGSEASTERSSEPPEPSSIAPAPAAPRARPAGAKAFALPKTHQRPPPAGLPSAVVQPGSALSPAPHVALTPARLDAKPAAQAQPRAAAQPQHKASAPAAPASSPAPTLAEPPAPTDDSVAEEEDRTMRVDTPPDDWFGAQPAPAPPAAAAAVAATAALPIAAAAIGRRTVAGVGLPPHPALSASLPFANLTPEPFAAQAPATPLAALPSPAAALAAPPVPAQPEPQPSSRSIPSSTGAPPVSVTPTGQRALPPGIPSLHDYAPKFSLAPEELVPRVSPSARVTRPRSGWARALGSGRANKALLAGALACIALASAIAVVLLLRRPPAQPDLPLEVAPAARGEADGEHAPSANDAPAMANAEPEPATPEAFTQDAGAEKNAAATPPSDNPDASHLDDAQLMQLFALERYTDVPECPQQPAAGKPRAKKGAAKEAKEAVRLLKVARKELARGKTEKAHGLLCRATTHDPSNSQAQEALAQLSLQLGNPAQARAAVAKALARKPQDLTLLGLLGDALALSGDLPGSRHNWLRTARGPGSDEQRAQRLANDYRKMAERLQRTSSYAAACSLFRRAVVLSEGSYAPSIGLAESLRRTHQAPAALAWAERAAHAFPNDSRVQVLYGNTLFDSGQKPEAFAAWKAARKPAQKLAKGKP